MTWESKASDGSVAMIGWAQLFGLLVLPLAYFWTLLPRGYSNVARVIFGIWALLQLLVVLTIASAVRHVVAMNSAATPPAAEAIAAREASAKDMSGEKEELRELYNELQDFKDDPEFLRVGYGQCCKYNDWKRRVERLSASSGPDLLKEVKFVPNDLITVGWEYVQSGGRPTKVARHFEALAVQAFAPVRAAKGEGVLTSTDRRCSDLDVTRGFIESIGTSNVAANERFDTDASCEDYYVGTRVGSPLNDKFFRFADGSGGATFIQVQVKDGAKIWVWEDDVEYN